MPRNSLLILLAVVVLCPPIVVGLMFEERPRDLVCERRMLDAKPNVTPKQFRQIKNICRT